MTQNGPYPGQPSQPWSAGGSDDEYQQPADPWGEQNVAWGGSPTSTPPEVAGAPTDYGMTGSGFAPTEPYGAPETAPTALPGTAPGWLPPPAPKRSGPGAPIVALVIVLGVLICGGLGATGWLLLNRPGDNDAATAATPTPSATHPAGAAEPDPQQQNSQDARFVVKGQCVRNDGTADTPRMTITTCAGGTFEVLARVDGRTTGEADAEQKCAKVKHYTKWYFYDSDLDSLDFVLCLREST
jgi:hypothetical protein